LPASLRLVPITLSLLCGEQKRQNPAAVKYWPTALAISLSLVTSLVVAEDFTTVNGKEYKNAEVTRVESDGIVLRTKSGISKVYFAELPADVQQRFHYDPARIATAQREREQAASRAQQDARPKQETTVAAAGSNFPITPILVVAILVVATVVVVAVVRAKQRRELRDLLFKQARDFAASLQQNRALPIVQTDIILKPGENAFYSTPSTLYETRAVRSYQAGHSGVRVAKGMYIGGTTGRSISTQNGPHSTRGRSPLQTNGWFSSARKKIERFR
jgi:hypothetical protein